jgi:putative spermidine/putrescine transport system ATP-binding protein
MRITLRGVSKRFGVSTAVDGLSLEIAPGELVALVGGSGCGKTTTLRLVAGFERPDAGEVLFDGRVVNDVPPARRGVGIVFQSYALFPTMTVANNVAFGLRVARWPQPRIRERVEELLTLMHLDELAGRYPNQLSGGQQQRVALARALARRPEILLLDEPLSALDAKIRLRLRAEIRKLQQDLGVTTLYVTHDQEEALSLADRLAVMRGGRIEQLGRPEEVYDRPRTGFVADFIGVSNLVPCRVVSAVDGVLEWEGRSLRAPCEGVADDTAVTLAVRPEKLSVRADATAGDGANRLDGVVDVVTFLGATVRLEVGVRGRPFWVDVPPAQAAVLPRKTRVVLTWRPEDGVVLRTGSAAADDTVVGSADQGAGP